MNRDRLSRHLLTAFLLALALYVLGYRLIESRRTNQMPWTAQFEVDTTGHVRIEVGQKDSADGLVEVRFELPVTNAPLPRTEVVFNEAKPVPFSTPVGQCIFQDTTFLPGTVVLEVGGTTLQMLPRLLTVGTNEFSWQQTHRILIQADGTCVEKD